MGVTPLIEPRYYIQYILLFNLLLHLGSPSGPSLSKVCLYLAADLTMLYVFLRRPFPCLVLGV